MPVHAFDQQRQLCGGQRQRLAALKAWSPPNGGQVNTQSEQAATLIGAERLRSQCFAMGKLGLGPIEFAQGFLPLSLETAGDKTIIRATAR
jgi:hypothetical protein